MAVLANFIAHFYTPIQPLKNKFVAMFKRIPFIHTPLKTILECPKCSGFVIPFFFFLSLPTAALTSFIAYLINHLIDRVEAYYE